MSDLVLLDSNDSLKIINFIDKNKGNLYIANGLLNMKKNKELFEEFLFNGYYICLAEFCNNEITNLIIFNHSSGQNNNRKYEIVDLFTYNKVFLIQAMKEISILLDDLNIKKIKIFPVMINDYSNIIKTGFKVESHLCINSKNYYGFGFSE